MYIRRLLKRFVLLNAFGEEGGGGGAAVDVPAAPAPEAAPAAPAPAAPATMLDAINQHFDAQPNGELDAQGQPRDEKGRFAPKAGDATPGAPAAPAVAAPAAPAVDGKPAEKKPGDPAKPDADLLQMPEGLQPKAQERFQRLANENRDLNERVQLLDGQVQYVRDTFQQHGIRQEQFEQAATVIGLMNSGDLDGALRVLDEQRKMISLALGRPLPGVDSLADHQDLRQAVEAQQITEQHALELARARMAQQATQQRMQTQQREQQTQQSQQQAVQTGMRAVDEFCKQMQASDVDYPAIEAQLLPEIQGLLAGVPPQLWAQAIQTQYRLIKKVAGTARQSAPSTGTVLRPTGQASPAAAPKTMFEAMWSR